MTDEEIEKAFICCIGITNEATECLGCAECPLFEIKHCKDILLMETRTFINKLKEEKYQLGQNLGQCENGYKLELTAERADNAILRNENEFLKNKCDMLERKLKVKENKNGR